jgi:aminopeptidase N
MLWDYVGYDEFQAIITNYLKKYKYRNTVTEDLWGEFDHLTGKPITQLMKQWTKVEGFGKQKCFHSIF